MKKEQLITRGFASLLFLVCFNLLNGQIPDPESFFGHKPGADRKMIRWNEMIPYFNLIEQNSDRIILEETGKTTLNNPFLVLTISSPDNLANLEKYKQISEKLARGRVSEEEASKLSEEGKTIALITCSMHATECGPTQMAPELAYILATDNSPEIKRILDNVILILVPCWNPDGNIMVTDWYRKNAGTEYERAPMPWLYHHYAGHDNNRDAFMHNLIETRYVNDILYHEWFPQIFMDMHHMSNTDARLLLSPLYEPRHHSLDPLLTREIELTGAYMRTILEEQGKIGVMHYANWNHWRMSAIHTSALWHNVTTILFEAAGIPLATPIYQDEDDLDGSHSGGLGKDGNNQTINYPSPWTGGWWRLRDIVEYSYWSCIGFLESAAIYKGKYLRNMYRMARNSIEDGKSKAPYAYLIRPDQKDPVRVTDMINILIANGVDIHRAKTSFDIADTKYPEGTYIAYLSQPYREFIIDMLGPQHYPDRRLYKDGPPERTFDITGWTLSYQMGVDVSEINEAFNTDCEPVKMAEAPVGSVKGKGRSYVIDHRVNNSYRAINRLLKEGFDIGLSTKPFFSKGKEYDVGSIIASGKNISRSIEEVAKEFNLQVESVNPVRGVMKIDPIHIGLYKSWIQNADEGWTRCIFDKWEFPYTSLFDQDIRTGNLIDNYDVILIPDSRADRIMLGHKEGTVPEEYAGGLGEKGIKEMRDFVQNGGKLVVLNSACQFAIDQFNLPLKDIRQDYQTEDLFCPSAILRVDIKTDHPLANGMEEKADVLVFNTPFLDIIDNSGDPGMGNKVPLKDMTIVSSYSSDDPFRSGRLIGGSILNNKPVLIEAKYGKGKIVLFAFRPQHRGQTHGTYKLFFNSLYYR